MIRKYEAELERPARTETAIAHRGIVELLLADWRRRLAAAIANSPGEQE